MFKYIKKRNANDSIFFILLNFLLVGIRVNFTVQVQQIFSVFRFSLLISCFQLRKTTHLLYKVSPDHHLNPYLNPQIPKLQIKANILEIFFEYLSLLLVIFAMYVSKPISNSYLAKNNYCNYRFIPKHHSRQYFFATI